MSENPGRSYAERDAILREMGYDSYKIYLASELWSRIRSRQLRLHPDCSVCGNPASQVHHTNYTRETLGGAKYKALRSVCRDCHRDVEFSDNTKLTLRGSNRKLDKILQDQAQARKDDERAAAEAKEANRVRDRAIAFETPRTKSAKQIAHEARMAEQAASKASRMAERRETEVAGRVVTDKERGMGWENVNCRPVSKKHPKAQASGIKFSPPPPKPLTLREQIEEQRRRLRTRNFA